jgi:hypothetical protein
MRASLLLPFIVLTAVVVGGLFFLYGGPAFHQSSIPSSGQAPDGTPAEKPNPDFTVLGQGQNANSIDQRVNYRITNADELTAIWELVYGTGGASVPIVDFGRQEVLALFDGSHSTGGYGIALTKIEDMDGTRMITITHTEPGERCITTTSITSPFVLVAVKKSSLPLSHTENTETTECP